MREAAMKLLVASTNAKKLRELRELVEGLCVEIVSPADLEHPLPEVIEDAETFAGNASKKALAYARASGLPTVADDSGLCVDALGGAPGIYSARYSGEEPAADRDEQNNAKLLRELEGVPLAERGAAFHCAIALALPDAVFRVVEARWRGEITLGPRGEGGFGYDPLFLLPELGRTSAELTAEEKGRLSHRGQATRLLVPVLEELAARARNP